MGENIFRVRIQTRSVEAFTNLLREHQYLDTAGERVDNDGTVLAEAYVPESKIAQLQKQPTIEIKIVEDTNQGGLERQREVPSTNQFARTPNDGSPPSPPRGLGKKE